MNTNEIQAAFVGKLGADPELRTSQAGKPWTRLRLAVGSGEATTWVSVAIFGSQAEKLAEEVAKGSSVYVEGALTLQTWQDRDGNARTGLSVAAFRAHQVFNLGDRQTKSRRRRGDTEMVSAASAESHAAPAASRARTSTTRARSRPVASPDDEIPF